MLTRRSVLKRLGALPFVPLLLGTGAKSSQEGPFPVPAEFAGKAFVVGIDPASPFVAGGPVSKGQMVVLERMDPDGRMVVRGM